ncbi:cation-translocating P-type ATPase [Marimonas arenosa]|uniref:HAD-IC family P-type ATPase n=1 Tax=Marimonas arenosa TaxID=1795305 RepID=A0AAE4B5M8_9RHOB|nr:HAD-IC family P-type ATPase [Marimonas arenosa]MDQ2091520.1 HAD-IC family P-type ATPase [Marimonas arenosa]
MVTDIAEKDRNTGLSSAEAARRLVEVGPNALAEVKITPAWRILLHQFTGTLVVLLIVAAVAAQLLGERVDALAIWLVVILNGVLGFLQEWRAENALAALRNMLSATARVIRDGRAQEIDTREIVPGDLVMIGAGDRVPADMRLINALEVRADESVLTGESFPVEKSVGGEDGRGGLMMGTAVVAGRGEGIVTATGGRTAFGQIAVLAGSIEDKETHLSRQLGRLARQLGLASVGIGAAIAVAGILVGRSIIEMVMVGLSLAVAIVPEGLPAVVTISLALGAAAMVRRQALARHLQAIETLGAASVICSDKTGTLTENRMTAQFVWIGGRRYEVSGTGYDPAGRITLNGQPVRHADDADLAALLEVAVGCTNASLHREGSDWEMVGDPTEGALVTLAYKGWTPLPKTPPLVEKPFSSERKRMGMVRRIGDDIHLLVKGAPERILDACTTWRGPDGPKPLDSVARQQILEALAQLTGQGQRVIALARKPDANAEANEEELEFLGLASLIDPPRPEVAEAIADCGRAGIRVIMITGDDPNTARAIAQSVGLEVDKVVTGAELDEIDDAALEKLLRRHVLFARTAPQHKMRLVQALQETGKIVGMTGDGVNDAPALKRADIGIAMGIRGTDVAKDAADLVLMDDNFATIAAAIREGRRQFENIRRFVRYLLSSNAGEVLAIIANVAFGGPLIFLPTQILWMNLVTDSVTALTLGLEKATSEQMRVPPRPLSAGILDLHALLMILAFGSYTAAASLYVFYEFLPQGEEIARTAAFTAMVLFEKSSVFAFRSFTRSCTRLGWFSNPWLILALVAMIGAQLAAVYFPPLQSLLRTQPLGSEHWQLIGLLCLPLILVPEGIKMVWRGSNRQEASE